jgi:MFS transporter, DHA2 family, multidrug resistance protein
VPPEAAEAARDTLGGALSAAQHLPDQVGGALVEAARTAFTQGLEMTATIGAVVALGIAILAATLLRDVRAGSESEEQPDLEPAEAAVGLIAMPDEMVASVTAVERVLDCAPAEA